MERKPDKDQEIYEQGFTMLHGHSDTSFPDFIRFISHRIKYLSDAEYRKAVEETFTPMARFSLHWSSAENGIHVDHSEIYICPDHFYIDGKDYSDLINLVVRHESYEQWLYVKCGWALRKPPEGVAPEDITHMAHKLALRDQYLYAHGTGQAKRYLQFILKVAETLPAEDEKRVRFENVEAFIFAKMRHDRLNGKVRQMARRQKSQQS